MHDDPELALTSEQLARLAEVGAVVALADFPSLDDPFYVKELAVTFRGEYEVSSYTFLVPEKEISRKAKMSRRRLSGEYILGMRYANREGDLPQSDVDATLRLIHNMCVSRGRPKIAFRWGFVPLALMKRNELPYLVLEDCGFPDPETLLWHECTSILDHAAKLTCDLHAPLTSCNYSLLHYGPKLEPLCPRSESFFYRRWLEFAYAEKEH